MNKNIVVTSAHLGCDSALHSSSKCMGSQRQQMSRIYFVCLNDGSLPQGKVADQLTNNNTMSVCMCVYWIPRSPTLVICFLIIVVVFLLLFYLVLQIHFSGCCQLPLYICWTHWEESTLLSTHEVAIMMMPMLPPILAKWVNRYYHCVWHLVRILQFPIGKVRTLFYTCMQFFSLLLFTKPIPHAPCTIHHIHTPASTNVQCKQTKDRRANTIAVWIECVSYS